MMPPTEKLHPCIPHFFFGLKLKMRKQTITRGKHGTSKGIGCISIESLYSSHQVPKARKFYHHRSLRVKETTPHLFTKRGCGCVVYRGVGRLEG